jgi:hypothetical protein
MADLQPAQEELHKQRYALREKTLLVEELRIEASDSSIALQVGALRIATRYFLLNFCDFKCHFFFVLVYHTQNMFPVTTHSQD